MELLLFLRITNKKKEKLLEFKEKVVWRELLNVRCDFMLDR